ncbi:MAG: hypothetical protein E6Z15_23735, partial [Paenibacillus macerans]|nr:hypothetical protein [Paenibacillus macerans]
ISFSLNFHSIAFVSWYPCMLLCTIIPLVQGGEGANHGPIIFPGVSPHFSRQVCFTSPNLLLTNLSNDLELMISNMSAAPKPIFFS